MNDARAPDKELIKLEYLKGIKQKDICEKHSLSLNTLKSWIKRYGWSKEKKGAPKIQKGRTSKDNKKIKVKKPSLNDVMENTDLTEKQKLFCIYYIENFNATKAYQKAYECNYNTAKTHGCKLLQNVAIKQEVDRLTNECLEEQEINSKLLSKRIFQKYIDIAFSDITDYITFGKQEREGEFGPYTVNYVDLKDSNNVDGSLISEISEGKDGIKIKLQDKMKALQWLSDRTDMLSDKDRNKLDIELLKLEMQMNKIDNTQEEVEEDGFIEAISKTIDEVWDDED